MFPDDRMGDVYSSLAFQALRRAAPGVDCEHLSAPAQKPNAAVVPNSYKQVKIQGERFFTGDGTVAAPVFIAKLNRVRRAADDHTKFVTIKKHVA